MKKFVMSIAALLFSASAALAANICDLDYTYSPKNSTALPAIVEFGANNEVVLVNVGLVRRQVHQLMEDVCYEGQVLPALGARTLCLGVSAHVSFQAGHTVKLLKTARDGDTLITTVRGLEKLLTLPEKNPAKFCRIAERSVGRYDDNPELWGLMCFNGETIEVLVEDLEHWQSLGATVGACEPSEPPAY